MRKVIAIISLLFWLAAAAGDDKPIEVTGHGRFVGEGSHSRFDCERGALEAARTNALAQAFGQRAESVSMSIETQGSDGKYSGIVDVRNGLYVQGEWIADKDVKYDYALTPEGNLIVNCTISGTVRKIHNEAIDYQADVLCKGTDLSCKSNTFNSGDKMYVHFRTPVDGYVLIYLLDMDFQAFNILPYNESTEQSVAVKRDKDYIFFSENHRGDCQYNVDEIRLHTDSDIERNEIIVIFSPNPFNKPMDKFVSSTVPRTLSGSSLFEWIAKATRADKKLTVKRIPVTITDLERK